VTATTRRRRPRGDGDLLAGRIRGPRRRARTAAWPA